MQVAAEDRTSLGTELRSSAKAACVSHLGASFSRAWASSLELENKNYDVYFVLLSPTYFLQCVGIKAENLGLNSEISCVQGEEKDFF